MLEEIMNRLESVARSYARSASTQNRQFVEGVTYGLMIAKAIVANPNLEEYTKKND